MTAQSFRILPPGLARLGIVVFVLGILVPVAARARLDVRVGEPYLGAIVVDAANGAVLFEDRADEQGYPASIVKLMDLLIILERQAAGSLDMAEPVRVTAEAAGMGGSQVYLREGEVFPVEELVYAMMVQSANDAATALALHVAGSRTAFVQLMNQRAAQLGLSNTVFYSVHGLPPAAGQMPDVSTARDLAVLAREVLKHPATLRYTSTRERGFREGSFVMHNHNRLLATVQGCDGLKTGYFTAAGYSVVATAERRGRRLVAVVLGSRTRVQRDNTARELLARGFAQLPPAPPFSPVQVVTGHTPSAMSPETVPATPRTGSRRVFRIVSGVLLGVVVVAALVMLGRQLRRSRRGAGSEP